MGLFDGTPLEQPVVCERCGTDVKTCQCPPPVAREIEIEAAKQHVKLRVEKRKRGKIMTVAAGFTGSVTQQQRILTELKNLCGAGGTIDAGNIEIQGNHANRIRDYLLAAGFKISK